MVRGFPPRRSLPIAAAADPRGIIRDQALRLGFDAVGFAPARLGQEVRQRLAAFVQAGMHGEMGWMEPRLEQRASPDALWSEARSVVCLALNYAPEADPLAVLERKDRGAVSVYAQGRDYHDVMKPRLKALARFICQAFPGSDAKVFVDTAPVAEKPVARQAGLGWQGKHTNLVSRTHGSWLFLGEVFTTLALEPDVPEVDHCGSCTRCLDVCPTRAFPAPYRLDARRCISYLTIEHRGPIPEELRPAIGNRIYGCDDCLAVCPWNKFAARHEEAAFAPRAGADAPLLEELAGLDDGAFRARFAGSPIKRIGRDRFVRNVMIAIGNAALPALRPAAEARSDDADPVVAEAARWAAARLG